MIFLRINLMGPIHVVEAFYPILAEEGPVYCLVLRPATPWSVMSRIAAHYIKWNIEGWREPDFLDRFRSFLCDTVKLPEAHQAGMAYSISKRFVKYFVYANVQRFASRNCRILRFPWILFDTHAPGFD